MGGTGLRAAVRDGEGAVQECRSCCASDDGAGLVSEVHRLGWDELLGRGRQRHCGGSRGAVHSCRVSFGDSRSLGLVLESREISRVSTLVANRFFEFMCRDV